MCAPLPVNRFSSAPGSFTLTANAASTIRTIAKVEFFNGTTLLGTATAAPYTYIWSNVPAGSYTLTAVATDALGIAATSAAISVSTIANVPPAISLTGPANGATATAPATLTLAANATSNTSSVTRVDFYNGTTLIGTATTAPYSFTWSNVPEGTYTLTAVATDTLSATTTSSPVTVTVNIGVAQAYYIHTDHLDTPRVITDTAGNTVWEWQNTDPFGNNVPNENPSGLGQFKFDLGFSGQYRDRETNTFYNTFRDAYDPALGRYTQFDPIGLVGGINGYVYALNNPLRYIDPLGLAVGDWWDFPANYNRAREIAQEELKKHHGHNNADDAQRHAEWSCRMENEINSFTAWSAGVGHEIDNLLHGGPLSESLMDLHNNNEGRNAASEGRPIDPNNLRTSPQSSGGSY